MSDGSNPTPYLVAALVLSVAMNVLVAAKIYFLENETTNLSHAVVSQAPALPKTQPPGNQPGNSEISGSSTALTAGWQIYRNEKYGFEFQYPKDWKLTQSEKQVEAVYALSDPKNPELAIDIYYSYFGIGGQPDNQCPISTHEIECKNLENKFGIKYAREIQTGQLELDKQQQLGAYFSAKQKDFAIQVLAILTDVNGQPLKSKEQIVNAFDQILSTFRFLK